MLARARRSCRASDDGWGFEVKWDGIRALAFIDGGRVRAREPQRPRRHARSTRSCASSAARSARAAADPRRRDRRASTSRAARASSASRRRMHLASDSAVRRRMQDIPVAYMIFDLLYLDGHSTMPLPYEERRELLEAARARRGRLAHARLPRAATAAALLEASKRAGPRGRRRQAARLPLRAGQAHRRLAEDQERRTRQDVVIGGWLPGEGGRSRQRSARSRSATTMDEATLQLRRQRRHRLHRADARARAARARAAARDTRPFERPPAAEGHDLRRAEARRRGRVPRLDATRHPATRPRSRACGTTRTAGCAMSRGRVQLRR